MNARIQTGHCRKLAAMALAAAVFGGGVAVSRPAMGQLDVAQPTPAYPYRDIAALEQLAAPVALYPDALLADVLVASTYPQEIAGAANYVNAGYSPAALDAQGWQPSVAAVSRFPSVINYMAANPAWTSDLANAYLNQQGDLVTAVGALRSAALAAGNLNCNNLQQVVVADGVIEIIPTDPRYIVLPIYDPACVYVSRPGICVSFGPRVEVGAWLGFDLDWHDRAVYAGNWGQDRPWWHRDGRAVYEKDRPGNFRSANVVNRTIVRPTVSGTTVQHTMTAAGRFQREDVRPAERVVARNVEVPHRDEARTAAFRPEPTRPQGLLQGNRGRTEERPQAQDRTSIHASVGTHGQVERNDAGSRSRDGRSR